MIVMAVMMSTPRSARNRAMAFPNSGLLDSSTIAGEMMRRCFFCLSDANSLEDAWPRWITNQYRANRPSEVQAERLGVRLSLVPRNRLGRYQWVVERTLFWLNRFRRLKMRYEHQADIHLAFLQLASPCVSSANNVQLARTVGLDRRARPLPY